MDRRPVRFPALVAIVVLVTVAACSGSAAVSDASAGADVLDGVDTSPDAPPIEVVPAPACAEAGVSVLHVAAWPGRGAALLLRSEGSADDRAALLAPGVLTLGGPAEAAVPMATAPATVDPSFVLVVVDAGAPARLAAAGFVAALPPGTSVALFRRCATVQQVSGFSSKRERVTELLQTGFDACPDGSEQAWTDALTVAAAEVWAIGSPIFPARRALVVISDGSPPAAADWPALPMGVDAYVTGPGAAGPSDQPSVEAFPLTPATFETSLASIADRLAARAEGLILAGACLSADMERATELHLPGGVTCALEIPKRPGEENLLPCDAAAIATGLRAAPATVQFLFTPDERATFDRYCADKVKDDFPLHVRVGDAEPVAAVAHLRGQTSLDCQRKSFTIDLAGGDLRVFGPGFAAEELHLISMCKDDRYFNQVTANELMDALGVFPLHRELTELQVDGVSWGVYELLQKPKDAVRETTSRLHVLVRRRFDPEDKLPDIEYPPNTTADAPVAEAYWQLVDGLGDLAGDALVAEARSRFDLDNYLTYVAFESLLSTGDYIDEIYFYGVESARRPDPIDWYDVHGWDMDDLFTTCHHSGQFAMPDPWGLVFCAEGDLEKRLLVDPVVYARYVDRLDDLISTRLTEQVFDQALTHTASKLLPFFDRPGVPAAMVELVKKNPAAVDAEVAKADILAVMDKKRQAYRTRRDTLVGLIAAWRAAR